MYICTSIFQTFMQFIECLCARTYTESSIEIERTLLICAQAQKKKQK